MSYWTHPVRKRRYSLAVPNLPHNIQRRLVNARLQSVCELFDKLILG
jgi:hypothetical protein